MPWLYVEMELAAQLGAQEAFMMLESEQDSHGIEEKHGKTGDCDLRRLQPHVHDEGSRYLSSMPAF